MLLRFYDDPFEDDSAVLASIFLAGPTAAGIKRTPWRQHALDHLEARHFAGTVFVPEFRDGLFNERAPARFGSGWCPVPNMKAQTYNILTWETAGIEQASVVLFWMPFVVGAKDDPSSLPGLTTRAEASREIARDPSRVVLGMPPTAESGGHIRFHAYRAGVPVASTLEETIQMALEQLARRNEAPWGAKPHR